MSPGNDSFSVVSLANHFASLFLDTVHFVAFDLFLL